MICRVAKEIGIVRNMCCGQEKDALQLATMVGLDEDGKDMG